MSVFKYKTRGKKQHENNQIEATYWYETEKGSHLEKLAETPYQIQTWKVHTFPGCH